MPSRPPLILLLNNEFIIEREILNFMHFDEFGVGRYFPQCCGEQYSHEVEQWLRSINGDASEDRFIYQSAKRQIRFFSVKTDNHYLIFGEADLSHLIEELCQELDPEISDGIITYWAMKHKKYDRNTQLDTHYLDELSHLNNDLINMQRSLAKKNVELQSLVEIRNRYVGMAAHDLRNPLGVIKNFSDFLVQTMRETVSADELDILKTIRSTSIFTLKLVESLLDLSAMQSGIISLNKSREDLNPLFENIISLNRILAKSHGIEIDFSPALSSIMAEVDATKIRQVVNNLLSNAIKYSPDDTTIVCQVITQDGYVHFSVKDQGIGISKEDLPLVFEPFRRFSANMRRQHSVGLGLSIVKNIVEAHGGQIGVTSEIDHGSCFWFTLPIL